MLQTKGCEHLHQMTVATNNKNSTVLMIFLCTEVAVPKYWAFSCCMKKKQEITLSQ